jgi:hypothetical protein
VAACLEHAHGISPPGAVMSFMPPIFQKSLNEVTQGRVFFYNQDSHGFISITNRYSDLVQQQMCQKKADDI